MMTKEKAMKLRSLIEQASASLPDKEASEGASLFPSLKGDGSLVKGGTRINWNGTVKRAAVDLWDNAENTPDAAPKLWEDIAYKDGCRYIPDTITATLAFAEGECGWWKDGKLYKSLIPANVHTPEQYAAGWEVVN